MDIFESLPPPMLKTSPGTGFFLNNSQIIDATSKELKLSLTCLPL